MASNSERGLPSLQDRTGTRFTVSFPDFPSFDVPPLNFRLYQKAGNHDVIEITFAQFSQFYFKSLKTGVPVYVSWRTDKAKGEFFGHVTSAKHATQNTNRRPVIIQAIAASFPLKEGGSKIWTNKTGPSIVSDIAKSVKLKPVVTEHSVIFPQMSLSGHTLWEKIAEIGQKIGYVHQVIGTELHFHPLDIMINKFMGSMPVLSFLSDYSGPYDSVLSQTLDKFEPKVGDFFDKDIHARKDKFVSYIDPVTGQSYTVSASPSKVGKPLRTITKDALFSQTLPTVMSTSKTMAESLAKAHATLSKFSITATGAGQGDPRISPYKTVEINGTGDVTDGFWVINTAEHFVSWDGRYLVDFTCMSDGTGTNKPGVNRPSASETVPTVPIDTSARPTKPTQTKLSGALPLISQTNAGYKLTPRRWVGR